MGKKRSRATQTSKGTTHQNPKRLGNRLSKAQRLEYKDSVEQGQNLRAAWRSGKRVMLTIANPDGNNTRERFIKVNANEVWGDWRFADKAGGR
jgi:hypothetical protein